MIRLRPRTARKRHPIEGGARTIRSSRRPLRAFTHTAQKWGQNNSFKWGHYCPSKTVHDRRADDDGVCCRVGARAVSAAPVNHDVDGGRCREDGALHMGDESDRAGADVLGEEDVREGKPLVESVVAHGRRSLTGLLGRLGRRRGRFRSSVVCRAPGLGRCPPAWPCARRVRRRACPRRRWTRTGGPSPRSRAVRPCRHGPVRCAPGRSPVHRRSPYRRLPPVQSMPSARRAVRTRAAVRCSAPDSSGCACSSR